VARHAFDTTRHFYIISRRVIPARWVPLAAPVLRAAQLPYTAPLHFRTGALWKNNTKRQPLIRLRFSQNIQIDGSLTVIRQWRVLVDEHDAGFSAKPRKVAQTLFERIPVLPEVGGKLQALSNRAKQILFSAKPPRQPRNERIGRTKTS